ncbi:MAG: TonB family protein, partial [Bacillota bacterium]
EPEQDEIEDSEPELESEETEEPESNPEPEPEEDLENEEDSLEEAPEPENEQVVTVEKSETEVEQNEKDINAEEETEETEEIEEVEEIEEAEETVNPEPEEDSTQAESDTTQTEEETPPSPGELIQTSPLPVYPKDLVGDAQTGTVLIEANISPEGEIISVEVEESSGIDSMDRNALSTVERGWSFRTYNRPYFMTIEVTYNVDERGNPLIDVQLLDISFE